MNKNLWAVILVTVSFVSVGCASTRPATSNNQLQIKVAQLERKLEDREMEITTLAKRLDVLEDDFDTMEPYSVSEPAVTYYTETIPEIRKGGKVSSDPGLKQDDRIIRVSAKTVTVQTALQKAGYYKGAIDGKIGAGTKSAIVNFQKDNGLKADGLVGRKTWDLLKTYNN